MPSRNRRNAAARPNPQERRACPSCAAAVPAEARFCPACGTSLAAAPATGGWSAAKWAGVGAFAAVIVVAGFAVVMFAERDPAPQPPPAFPASPFGAPRAASPGGPPDLSRMTPREAADRLFDRIMTASEKGNQAEARRFVPMALQAYAGLPSLDRDAYYHLGLIHGVAGDRASVELQIAALRQGAPNHLLAFVLEHDLAEQSGDGAAASRVRAAFAAAYDAEIALGRPEYDFHRNVVDSLRAATVSPIAPFTGKPTGAP